MNKIEDKAWNMLTKIEQNVLSLSLSVGLSTWEAGEILKISHYKYLEIKERSEKMFKLFIDYFNQSGSTQIFCPKTVVDDRFRDYIEACIEKRMTRVEAANVAGDASLKVTTVQTKHIVQNMARLKNSPSAKDQMTHMLILEFDRWNNKRILPRKLQMPTPFRRKMNRREKFYIKYINKLNPSRVENMLSAFHYRPAKQTSSRKFIALISKEVFPEGYQVISVRNRADVIEKLTKLSTYVFHEEDHADVFGYLTTSYEDRVKGPRKGQKFWPEYRSVIGKAINFKDMNNIHFYAEDLEKAYNSQVKPKKEKAKRRGKRTNEELFYN